MTERLLQPHRGRYRMVRRSAGLKPVYQDNRVAPARRGMWAFFAGTHKRADNVPMRPGARWHTFSIAASQLVYVGWDARGYITHDGFFNVGEWHLVTAEEAAARLRRHVALARGIAVGHRCAPSQWPYFTDAANFQVFVPSK